MRTGLIYTSARLLLLVAAMGLLYLAGARGILLLALALVVSALASYVLLAKQRDAMSAAIARRFGRPGNPRRRIPGRGWAADFRARLDEGTRAEDGDESASAGIEVPGRSRQP
jgi:hypothetical protein